MNETQNYALTRLYHPSGAQVSIPISINQNDQFHIQAQDLFKNVDALLAAGFLVNAPGLEQGELIQEVVSVSRREHSDNTPIIAFYVAHPKMVNKLLHAYLNKPEDVAAFEAVTGLKINSIPLWEGETYIKKDSPKASKYIVTLPKPIKVVYEITDKWKRWEAEGKQGNEPQKNQLVRYDGYTAPVKTEQPAIVADPSTGEVISEGETNADDVQHEKMSAEFINTLSQLTNLKPGVIAPILGKLPSKTMSVKSALALIKSNIPQE